MSVHFYVGYIVAKLMPKENIGFDTSPNKAVKLAG
jgi:hypothetical protein